MVGISVVGPAGRVAAGKKHSKKNPKLTQFAISGLDLTKDHATLRFRESLSMFRRPFLAVVLCVLACHPCLGQEWAVKDVPGDGARFRLRRTGGQGRVPLRFREHFTLEDIHISDVRTSCGCTTPSVETPLLKTYEQGAILAHFNTTSSSDSVPQRSPVTIDRPFYAEVQLQIRGYIRGDVVVEPGSVQVGSLDQGTGADRTVAVSYAGRSDWQITGVNTSNPHISAKAVETARDNGQVSYALQVHVDKTTPTGYLNDHLMLVTNDGNAQIPVLVEGRGHGRHYRQPNRALSWALSSRARR